VHVQQTVDIGLDIADDIQNPQGKTRCGRPRLNYTDYMTGMKTNELVDVSQDREAWRELVVACVDLQPPD